MFLPRVLPYAKGMKKYLLALSFSVFACKALAFQLSPMVIQFSPEGARKTQVLTLENNGGEKVPLQIEAFSRHMDAKGEEVRQPTTDFVIYPEQVVLLPGEKRNVRLTWGGTIENAQEKAYRIVATQVPVNFKEKNAQSKKSGVSLNFLLQYVASAYVSPEGAVAKIKVKSVKALTDKKIELILKNEGTAHQVLHVKELSFLDGKKVVLKMNSVKELESANLLAQSEKTFLISLSQEIKAQNLSAQIDFSERAD